MSSSHTMDIYGYVFVNMIVYWWNLNQRPGFLDMQVSTMQLFDWLDWCASLTRWQSHISWAWRLESLVLVWDLWCGLKNRAPHVIDHGWWLVKWLGAWGFLGSESRAQETQRLWQLKLRSGWAVVSDGPRSPATIHWSVFCGTYSEVWQEKGTMNSGQDVFHCVLLVWTQTTTIGTASSISWCMPPFENNVNSPFVHHFLSIQSIYSPCFSSVGCPYNPNLIIFIH